MGNWSELRIPRGRRCGARPGAPALLNSRRALPVGAPRGYWIRVGEKNSLTVPADASSALKSGDMGEEALPGLSIFAQRGHSETAIAYQPPDHMR